MDAEDSDKTISTTASAITDADQVRMMSDSRSGRIIPTMKLKVASRNARTCKADSTQMLLDNEMKKYGLNICCLPETRLNDILMKSIESTDSETFKFYNCGPTDGRGFHGVGFLLNSIDASSVLSWQPVSARISALRLKGRISNVLHCLSTRLSEIVLMTPKMCSTLSCREYLTLS